MKGYILLLLVAVPCAAPGLTAQLTGPTLGAREGTVPTLDAARLDTVVALDAPWRFQAGDDPRYADPAYDDSAWPALHPGQTFESAGLPALDGACWARLHLHLQTGGGPLGIAIARAGSHGALDYKFFTRYGGLPYAVYANGQPIAASRNAESKLLQTDPPFAIGLPQSADLVIAVRFFPLRQNWTSVLPIFPIRRFQIGPLSAVRDATELARIRDFDAYGLSQLVVCLAFLAFAPFALALYLAQRAHSEYLWLALSCFFLAACLGFGLSIGFGVLTWSSLNDLAWHYTAFLWLVCCLEFVMRFVQAKRRGYARPLEALFLVTPLIGLAGYEVAFFLLFLVCLVLWFGFLSFHLLSAYRNRVSEAKLLLPPFAFLALVVVFVFGAEYLPGVFPAQPRFHLGTVGFGMVEPASMLFIATILAVVFYRFIRTSRNEQRSAAEFEAARTVQQVLIPDVLPSVPGFAIQSVYMPAGQVGGDFFQILPARSGGVLVAIGDVSGKGMPAAMTVALLVGTFRTLAHFTESPSEILAAMNQRMINRSGGGFTTCLVLRADADGKLTIANAGHIAPYLAGKELQIENGLPLGLAAETAYAESRFDLAPGEQLTLVTDGVVEARDKTGALLGFERTAAISGQSADQIAKTAELFGQDDDITVLTLVRMA